MHPIIIPFLIIAVIVGFYYAYDVWQSVRSSIPFLGDKKLELPGSQEKSDSSPTRNSPFDVLE